MSTSTINKVRDTVTYLGNRAESKLSEAKEELDKKLETVVVETKLTLSQPREFWVKNGNTLVVGTGIGAIGMLLLSNLLKI